MSRRHILSQTDPFLNDIPLWKEWIYIKRAQKTDRGQ